jgi:glycosyltransferase involved in cell wall biosynthesis
VLLVVRDVERTIRTAVQSIVQQSMGDWELLLIDDGSSDRTVEIARAFTDPRIRLIVDGDRRGLPARLNAGIAAARGKYIARMDGDDVAYPQRLAVQLAFLESHPSIDLVGASVLVFRGDGAAVGVRRPPASHPEICRGTAGFMIVHPTYFGRASWFRAFQYDATCLRAQDQDLLLRAHFTSTYANVPEILLGYREDTVTFSKSFRGRRHFLRSIVRTYGPRREYGRIVAGAAAHGAKLAFEALAVAVGGRRLLSHRALRATPAELQEWQRIWSELTSTR